MANKTVAWNLLLEAPNSLYFDNTSYFFRFDFYHLSPKHDTWRAAEFS